MPGLRQAVPKKIWRKRCGLFASHGKTTSLVLAPAVDFSILFIEYARNVFGFKDAQHAEYNPYASKLFISQLACSLASRAMQLSFVAGSQVASIYGDLSATEHYYCNFGVNPDVVGALKQGPLLISGSDSEGEVRVVEYPDHPFFLITTLFVPQTRSTPEIPHPLVTAFLRAVLAEPTKS